MNAWVGINRCVMCGSKLRFVPTSRKDGASREEGAKICEYNHERFSVYGGYDSGGNWQVSFVLPRKGARHEVRRS